jgi:hypothetical protein
MVHSEKTFYRIFLPGLLLCLALYAEETVHFLHYGWNSPDNAAWIGDLSKCQRVPGSNTDLECQIRGYGLARYRYRQDAKDPKNNMPNHIFFVDRIP